MDNFREEVVVKRNRLMNTIAYFMSWVTLILSGLVAFMGLSSLMMGNFQVMPIVMTVVFGGLCYLIWRNKDEFRAEYEYSFTNGDLDVSKVLGNSRRKYLTSLAMKNVEACGVVTHQSFQRYLSMKDVKKHNWFLNRESNLYYFYFTKNAVKHMIVVELSDEMVELVKKYLGFGIWQG